MEEIGWRIGQQSNTAERDQLLHMREEIDELDTAIANLLKRRMQLSQTIGEIKAKAGVAVKDSSREARVLAHVAEVVNDDRLEAAVVNVYRALLEESCGLQAKRDDEKVSPLYFPRVAVIGVGLVGGALARQIRKRLPDTVLVGCDKKDVLAQALAEGVIDEAAPDAAEAIRGASLILLCATPRANVSVLRKIASQAKRRQVIVDVSSTKQDICGVASELPLKADFIGGHPLFGSHRSGLSASRDVAVDGKSFCLVPTSHSSELSLRRVSRWLSDLGLRVVCAEATTHDAGLARTSHLVQLSAVALGAVIAGSASDAELRQRLLLSGPALHGIARLMSSPPDMWMEILESNSKELLPVLKQMEISLSVLRAAIKAGDRHQIAALFAEASRVPAALQT